MSPQKGNSPHKTCDLPGGGAPRPIGGGAPRPGGYWVGAPAMLAPAAAASEAITVVTCCEGPPTPLTAPAGTPRPAARPTPGPQPPTPLLNATTTTLTSFGGGPSTVIETRFPPSAGPDPGPSSPLTGVITQHATLSVRVHVSGSYLIFLNSSQSHRIRFMCLSKALKVPMKMRPSCRMHLILKSMCCSILLLLPTVWNQSQTR
uniref:Uncharacterized protein n=1 Tax=Sphaeramia orbicularis TaxID=375764 RepID=A0A672ZYB7_9TELE